MITCYCFVTTGLLQRKTSHKFIDMSENPIMRLYYTDCLVLFFMCAGNEACYADLYLLHFTERPICEYHKIYFFSLQREHERILHNILFFSGWYWSVQINCISECSNSVCQSCYFCTTWICVVHQSQHY